MTINYGKREPGGLTAANPGDILYIPFATYVNGTPTTLDTGFGVDDIEVFKNGVGDQRLTDSGYAILGDTGADRDFDGRPGLHGISIRIFNTADDTGFYDVGSQYWVAVDHMGVGGVDVRGFVATFEIGRPRVNAYELAGDTGAANWLKSTFAAGFADTGVNERLARIQSDVDSGLRVHIDDLDTGLHAHISDVDTGLHQVISVVQSDVDTGLRTHINDLDTGLHDTLADYDTGLRAILTLTGVAVTDTGINERLGRIQSDVDTGLRAQLSDVDTGLHDTIADLDTGLRDFITDAKNELDTGGVNVTATVDTGVINQAVWQADAARSVTDVTGFSDTGVNERLARIQSDVDSGLRVHIDDLDTGLHAHISDVDTGLHATIAALSVTVDTGVVNQAVWQADASRVVTGVTGFSDTGVNERLARIQSDVDTGIRVHIDDLDTGLHAHISDVDTGIHQVLSVVAFDVDTGLRAQLSDVDTGLHAHVSDVDTGLHAIIAAGVPVASISDTGVNERLARIQSDVDTGLRVHIDDLDTGLHAHIADVDSGAVEKTLQGMANRIWNADMAEMADSGTAARRTPLQAVRALRNRVEMDTGSMIVFKEDDLTTSWTGTLETDTGAKPVKTIDPA